MNNIKFLNFKLNFIPKTSLSCSVPYGLEAAKRLRPQVYEKTESQDRIK